MIFASFLANKYNFFLPATIFTSLLACGGHIKCLKMKTNQTATHPSIQGVPVTETKKITKNSYMTIKKVATTYQIRVTNTSKTFKVRRKPDS